MMNFNRKAVGALLLSAAWLLSGCSHQDFSNPSVAAPITDAMQSGRPYVVVDPQVEAASRAANMARVMDQWKREFGGPREYHVGPDDVLEISVLALEEPGKIGKLLRTVQGDGSIVLPWTGMAKVAGLTLREAEARIRDAMEGRFIKNPQVEVVVSQFRSAPVVITGAVKKPGIYYLRSDAASVLELLVEADGLNAEASSQMFLIRSRGTNVAAVAGAMARAATSDPALAMEADSLTNVLSTAPAATGKNSAFVADVLPVPQDLSLTNSDNMVLVDLKRLIDEGDLRLNLWVRGGDILNVPPKMREYFYVLGYVARPGVYSLDQDRPPGALQAVAMAGGLTAAARGENTCLLRQTTNGLKVIAVDLTKIARGVRPPFEMTPGDTLVVGSSFMARLGEFVKPSVGLGVSAGTSFVP